MKLTLEQTSRIVELRTETGTVPARVWEGTTAHGVAVHAYITRIAAAITEDTAQLEEELQEMRPMTPALDAVIPSRLIL